MSTLASKSQNTVSDLMSDFSIFMCVCMREREGGRRTRRWTSGSTCYTPSHTLKGAGKQLPDKWIHALYAQHQATSTLCRLQPAQPRPGQRRRAWTWSKRQLLAGLKLGDQLKEQNYICIFWNNPEMLPQRPINTLKRPVSLQQVLQVRIARL